MHLLAANDRQPPLVHEQRPGRRAVRVDRAADRRDLRRRRSAAASDHARAEIARLRSELREVLGCRVRVDDPRAGKAGETDVRERREHEPVAFHFGERRERRGGAGAVVRADRGEVELREALAGLPRADAAERLRVLVERHQRDDRQRRNSANRLDRRLQLVEVVERLEHEEVGAAAFEDRRLLGEEVAARLGPELDVPERTDRAGDEDVAAGDLARLPREADGRRVDLPELVLEEMRGELRPVRAERVRLDQLRAGADVADVHRDHALRLAEVRLLGTAQARHRGGDQRAHPAVGDDRRTGLKALDKAVHAATLVK